MKRLDKVQIFRIIVQIIFLLLLPGLISLAFLGAKDIFVSITTGDYSNFWPNASAFIIISLLTIFAGRVFCGWMCIFGSLNDWIYFTFHRFVKKKLKMSRETDKYLKYVKFVILILIIAFVWTGIVNLPDGSSPWDAYGQIFDIKNMLTQYALGTAVLILIAIGAMYIERFFCRYLCPLGAMFVVLSKFKLFKIHKEKIHCANKCKACSLKCSMGINLDAAEVVNSGECIHCFRCINVCPKKNARVQFLDEDINGAAFASTAIATTVGVYLLANMNTTTNISTGNNNTNTDVTQNTNTETNTNTNTNTNTETNTNTNTTTSTNTKYKDGTYTGSARGYRPGFTVSVTVKNDKITNIEIVSCNDTPGFYERAVQVVPNEIIQAQTTNVKAVSGATRSSDGIMNAVDAALANAQL